MHSNPLGLKNLETYIEVLESLGIFFHFSRPFYGYHKDEQEFIKIQFYNPRMVAKYGCFYL